MLKCAVARLGAVRAGLEQAQVLAGRLDGAPQVTPAVAAVARRALRLFVKCFGFDYADESANVVVPPSWRPIVTRGDAAHTVMATLFYLHKHQVARPTPHLALEALVMLTSMRRSTFADKGALTAFLAVSTSTS